MHNGANQRLIYRIDLTQSVALISGNQRKRFT